MIEWIRHEKNSMLRECHQEFPSLYLLVLLTLACFFGGFLHMVEIMSISCSHKWLEKLSTSENLPS